MTIAHIISLFHIHPFVMWTLAGVLLGVFLGLIIGAFFEDEEVKLLRDILKLNATIRIKQLKSKSPNNC